MQENSPSEHYWWQTGYYRNNAKGPDQVQERITSNVLCGGLTSNTNTKLKTFLGESGLEEQTSPSYSVTCFASLQVEDILRDLEGSNKRILDCLALLGCVDSVVTT